MYPNGMFVQVIGNTNNHWFEKAEFERLKKKFGEALKDNDL